jgi:hypothetical protein
MHLGHYAAAYGCDVCSRVAMQQLIIVRSIAGLLCTLDAAAYGREGLRPGYHALSLRRLDRRVCGRVAMRSRCGVYIIRSIAKLLCVLDAVDEVYMHTE